MNGFFFLQGENVHMYYIHTEICNLVMNRQISKTNGTIYTLQMYFTLADTSIFELSFLVGERTVYCELCLYVKKNKPISISFYNACFEIVLKGRQVCSMEGHLVSMQ